MGLKTPAPRPSCERLSVTQMSASKLQLETARRLVQQETRSSSDALPATGHVLQWLLNHNVRGVRVQEGQLPPKWDLF